MIGAVRVIGAPNITSPGVGLGIDVAHITPGASRTSTMTRRPRRSGRWISAEREPLRGLLA